MRKILAFLGIWLALVIPCAAMAQVSDVVYITVISPVDTVVINLPVPDTLNVGDTYTYTAIVLDTEGDPIPGAIIVWTSSNPAAVQIDQTGLATMLSKSDSVAITATVSTGDPVDPLPPGPVLFSDGLETGDFLHTENSFSWSSPNRTSIVRDDGYVVNNGSPIMTGPFPEREWENGPESAGHHAMRFRYPANDNMAEQRFTIGSANPEIWVSFWWRVPINFFHNSGNSNQKLSALWMDGYEGSGFGPTVTTQFRENGSGGSNLTVYYYATDEGQAQRHSGEIGGGDLITTPDDRGRWMHLIWHARAATDSGTADGVIQIWRKWEGGSYSQLVDISNAAIHAPDSGPIGFQSGYVMGWANAPYSENTEFLMDDFVIHE